MQKNELLQWNNTIIRILAIDDARVLVIDCVKMNNATVDKFRCFDRV